MSTSAHCREISAVRVNAYPPVPRDEQVAGLLVPIIHKHVAHHAADQLHRLVVPLVLELDRRRGDLDKQVEQRVPRVVPHPALAAEVREPHLLLFVAPGDPFARAFDHDEEKLEGLGPGRVVNINASRNFFGDDDVVRPVGAIPRHVSGFCHGPAPVLPGIIGPELGFVNRAKASPFRAVASPFRAGASPFRADKTANTCFIRIFRKGTLEPLEQEGAGAPLFSFFLWISGPERRFRPKSERLFFSADPGSPVATRDEILRKPGWREIVPIQDSPLGTLGRDARIPGYVPIDTSPGVRLPGTSTDVLGPDRHASRASPCFPIFGRAPIFAPDPPRSGPETAAHVDLRAVRPDPLPASCA